MGEKNNSKNKVKRKKVKKKPSILARILVLFSFLAIIIFGGGYMYLSTFSNDSIDITSNDKEKNQVENVDSANFLVMGVDLGSGDENDKNDPRRTDTIMLVHYNKVDKKYDVISIPRDTMVQLDEGTRKINDAHAIGGVQYLVDTVEDLLSVNIDYYLKVDTIAFREIIDALGGVDIVIDQNMYYDDEKQDLHIYFEASDEPQHLDGKKAEGFFRWRKNNDDTGLAEGDIGRIKQQQKFFNALLDKVQSPTIVTKVPKLLGVFPKYVETNLSAMEIMDYGLNVVSTPIENIKFHTLNGEPEWINGTSYYIYKEEMNNDILSILNNEVPMTISKSNLRVNVLNGTNVEGLAGNFVNDLLVKGYNHCDAANYDQSLKPVHISEIRLYGLKEEDKQIIEKDFGISNIKVMEEVNPNYEIEVILGEDVAN
ncbi:MAG: LCP family protein [Clostridium sp.]